MVHRRDAHTLATGKIVQHMSARRLVGVLGDRIPKMATVLGMTTSRQ